MELKPMTEADRPTIERWINDEKLMYYILTDKPNKELPIVSLGIYIGDNELIGWATLFNIDYDNLKAEFGIAIPNLKHLKLGVFASRQIMAYGFRELGLHRIYVRPLASNIKEYPNDIRDKGGFVREGIERQAVKRGEVYEDVIVMGIFKDEFERKWAKCQQQYHI